MRTAQAEEQPHALALIQSNYDIETDVNNVCRTFVQNIDKEWHVQVVVLLHILLL